MKKTLLNSLTIAALATTANAATLFTSLTAVSSDDPNDGINFGAGGLAALTNDTFTYNDDNPTATFPVTGGAGPTFHGNNGNDGVDIIINFTIDAISVSAGDMLFVDLYGRSGTPTIMSRDNDIIVEFLDGTTVVGTSGQSGIDGDLHSRAEFTVTAPTANVTGFRVIGGDTAQAGTNIFTLAEVRGGVVAVPEPSSTALLGLAGLALILRRRK